MVTINNSKYEPGRHILLDCKGELAHYDGQQMLILLKSAAQTSNAKVLSSHFHCFGEGQGITGVLILSESHITVHTWPELDYAAFDIFMCGECDPENAARIITENLHSDEFNKQTIYREAGNIESLPVSSSQAVR